MQKEYGRITVPISEKRGIPSSPQVWGSFLSGKYLQEGLDFKAGRRRGERTIKILKMIKRILPLSLGLAQKVDKPLEHSKFPERSFETFLDFAGVREVNAPYYSFDYRSFKISFQYSQGEISINECVADLEKLLLDKQRLVLRELWRDSRSKVIFFFIHALDVLQHITFVKGPDFLRRYYEGLDVFLFKVKKIEDNVIIVVSDHGFDFDTETHSMKGFYSCNKVIKPKPNDIIDFYGIVGDFLKRPGVK